MSVQQTYREKYPPQEVLAQIKNIGVCSLMGHEPNLADDDVSYSNACHLCRRIHQMVMDPETPYQTKEEVVGIFLRDIWNKQPEAYKTIKGLNNAMVWATDFKYDRSLKKETPTQQPPASNDLEKRVSALESQLKMLVDIVASKS